MIMQVSQLPSEEDRYMVVPHILCQNNDCAVYLHLYFINKKMDGFLLNRIICSLKF
jgi:hypothetical protein